MNRQFEGESRPLPLIPMLGRVDKAGIESWKNVSSHSERNMFVGLPHLDSWICCTLECSRLFSNLVVKVGARVLQVQEVEAVLHARKFGT